MGKTWNFRHNNITTNQMKTTVYIPLFYCVYHFANSVKSRIIPTHLLHAPNYSIWPKSRGTWKILVTVPCRNMDAPQILKATHLTNSTLSDANQLKLFQFICKECCRFPQHLQAAASLNLTLDVQVTRTSALNSLSNRHKQTDQQCSGVREEAHLQPLSWQLGWHLPTAPIVKDGRLDDYITTLYKTRGFKRHGAWSTLSKQRSPAP